jgi:hypothetical protein
LRVLSFEFQAESPDPEAKEQAAPWFWDILSRRLLKSAGSLENLLGRNWQGGV